MKKTKTNTSYAKRNKKGQFTSIVSWLNSKKFWIFILLLSVPNIIIGVHGRLVQNSLDFLIEEVEAQDLCGLDVVECESEKERQPSMREWVFNRLEQNLGTEEAINGMIIITCESGWNPDALNVNTNKTADLGLWQINHPLHSKTISRQQSLDYQIATDWAIKKRLNDGNWSAWVCARVLGIN